MLRLRTLEFTAVFALFSANVCWGLTHSVSMSVQTDSRRGSLDIADLNRQFGTSQVSEQFSHRMEGILDSVATQASVVIVHPDYSSVLVRNKAGIEAPLSTQVGSRSEFVMDLGADWAKGANSASLGWRGNVNGSPFFSNLFRGAYSRSFFSQATSVGLQGSYLSQRQPESYFVDRDFQTKARPQSVNAYEIAFLLDQILSEKWKMRNRVGISQRIEERPRNYFLSSRHAYALTDRLFADLQLTYADELRSETLKNERGYFRAYGARVGLSAEIFYDLVVSASYGILFERERDPRIEREVEVASDQYGLGVIYSFSQVEFEARAGYVVSNTNIRNLSLSGGATWRL